MTINCKQLKEIVIIPSLTAMGMLSQSAIQLLLGTAAQETQLGRYLVQTNVHPFEGGIGIYQMESQPYNELWDKFIERSAPMKARVLLFTGYTGKPPASRMATDLFLATIMARLYYARVVEPLPNPTQDIPALAAYWKKYYNSYSGNGTVEEFILNYNKYVT